MILGFIFSPDYTVKFQEEFEPLAAHRDTTIIENYGLFPALRVYSSKDMSQLTNHYDFFLITCEEEKGKCEKTEKFVPCKTLEP